MMANVVVRHRIKDYAGWKAVFAAIDMRRAGGEKSYQIFHAADDPNNLVVLLEWDSLANARAFLTNPVLNEEMGKAGVIEEPDVYILKEYDRGKT